MAVVSALEAELVAVRAELARMTGLRQEERIGRTRAEKALRQLRNAVSSAAATTASASPAAATGSSSGSAAVAALAQQTELPPAEGFVAASAVDATRAVFIGRVRSCYWERNGTPNQPQRVPASRAQIVMDKRVSLATCGGFDGLAEFSHLWVTFLFHGNTGRAALKAKVTPPRHGTADKVGVWACRSPHRVNELGLSLVEMVAVDAAKGIIHVRGIDLLDNTPVVDVKPYIPAYDSVQPPERVRVPAWVRGSVDRPADFTRIAFSDRAAAILETICTNKAHPEARTLGYEGLYAQDAAAFVACVQQTLQWDIRSHHQRAQQVDTFSVLLDGVRFRFAIDLEQRVITVTDVVLERLNSTSLPAVEEEELT